MQPLDTLTFAQNRERLLFKWAIGSALGGFLSLATVVASMLWLNATIRSSSLSATTVSDPAELDAHLDRLHQPMQLASGAAVALVISAGCFLITFIAWLVWMRRRRKLQAGFIACA